MTPNRSRPALAELERRTVPAGITVAQGNLVVDGTPGADTIRVYFYGTARPALSPSRELSRAPR